MIFKILNYKLFIIMSQSSPMSVKSSMEGFKLSFDDFLKLDLK